MSRHGTRRREAAMAVALLATIATFSTPGRAGNKEQCIAAFNRGQDLREQLKLTAARQQFLACSHDACSPPLRKDCAEGLEGVTRDLPTIVLGARDKDGRDLPVQAWLDDQALPEDGSGRSVSVDPGQHTLRFEHAPDLPVLLQVTMRMGERNRSIVATFEPKSPPKPAGDDRPKPLHDDAPEAPPREPPQASSPRSPFVYVLGGVAVVGIGAFAYLGATGYADKKRLTASCGNTCTDNEVSQVRTKYIAGDVSLGVGLVALALATYLVLSEKPAAAKASLSLSPAVLF